MCNYQNLRQKEGFEVKNFDKAVNGAVKTICTYVRAMDKDMRIYCA